MHRSHYDVGIIGSGIAGAALATALTRQGFTVALLDRRPGLLDTARGDHIQPGVQPLLERWGVLESLMLAGAEKRYGTRWLDGEGNHIVTIPVPDHPECPPYFLFLNHEQIGEVLLSRATQAGARSVTNVSHWSIERGNGHWTVNWKQAEDIGEFDCTLLVGADGTASSVRRTLKMDIERHRYQYPIAVLYGQLRDVPERRTLDVFVTADRIVSMIPARAVRVNWDCRSHQRSCHFGGINPRTYCVPVWRSGAHNWNLSTCLSAIYTRPFHSKVRHTQAREPLSSLAMPGMRCIQRGAWG